MKEQALSHVKKILQEYSINTNDYNYQVNEIGDQVNGIQVYQVFCSNMISNKSFSLDLCYNITEDNVVKHSINL